MKSKKVIARDQDYVLGTYGRAPLVIEEGLGMVAQSPEGQEYLDFTSGIGVNCLGFCDPDWSFAVAQQASKLQHISNLYYTNPCTKLAKKLCTRTGMSKVFFGNSGAEANEGALKAARKYSFDKYGAGRNKIISLENSFHGRTMATLTATGQDSFHNFFFPFNQGFGYVPANDFAAFKKKATKNVCAIIIELVQGGKLNRNTAVKVFEAIFLTDEDVDAYVQANGLEQVSDTGLVAEVVDKIFAANPKSIEDYKAGKEKAFAFLVGQTMRELRGKADPQVVNTAVREKLDAQ